MILIVDDEDSLRAVGVELLKILGYRVLQAADGVEAAKVFALHQEDIKLVITDVVMPNRGGVDLANILWQTNPSMPVVFMTGYDKNQLANIVFDEKHSKVLLKPFSVDELEVAIQDMLNAD